MSVRQRQRGKTYRSESPLPTGYEGLSSDLFVPSCGLEDVDLAMRDLFKKQIAPTVVGKADQVIPVSVRFSSGEKWSLYKLWKNDRDKSDVIDLPLISVWRKPEMTQSDSDDVSGRGINAQTGELVISRRLVKHGDRQRQALANRLGLLNRTGVATSSHTGSLSNDPVVASSGLLLADRTDNVIETITMPSPQFYTLSYEITVWAQFQKHMNSIMEQIISSFSQVGSRSWRIESEKGYWFVATADESVSGENSLDDESGKGKLLTHVIPVKVPMYVLPSVDGKVPVKRNVSCNTVDFDLQTDQDYTLESNASNSTGTVVGQIGADDPTLPLDTSSRPRRRDLRYTGAGPIDGPEAAEANDPALSQLLGTARAGRYEYVSYVDRVTGERVAKLVRVSASSPRRGESAVSFDMTSIDAESGIQVRSVLVK